MRRCCQKGMHTSAVRRRCFPLLYTETGKRYSRLHPFQKKFFAPFQNVLKLLFPDADRPLSVHPEAVNDW